MTPFDADGIVLTVGDEVEFQMFDDAFVAYHGIGAVIEIVDDMVFVSEPGNGGAEGWIKSECVRLYV
jgi:hypothetical protein